MADTKTKKPWHWWIGENVFPWEQPPTTGKPRGVTPEGKWRPFSSYGAGDKEFDAFYDWAVSVYGSMQASALNPNTYRDSPQYEFWLKNVKPSPAQWTVKKREEEIGALPPGEQWTALKPTEKEGILTGDIDPAQRGFPAGKGYRWERKYDTATRTYRWVEVEDKAAEPTITFTSQYGGRVLLGSDGKYYRPDDRTVEMDIADVTYAYNEYLAQVNQQKTPPTPSKLDPSFRAWLVKEYGEDVAAHYDQMDYRDAKLTELRNYYNTFISPDKLARDKAEEEKRRYEEERRRREYQEQIERERQQAEAKNKEWQAQYDIQKQQSESAIQKQQNEMELIKGRAFPFPYEQGNRQAYQGMQSSAFESARQSILGSLSSPADWIKRWEVQNAPNPYTAQPKSSLEEKQGQLTDTETRANMFDQMADESENLATQLSANQDYGAGTPNEATVLTQARNDAVMYRNAAKAERNKIGVYQTDVTYLQGQPQPEPSQPVARGNAPAPSWLPMFAPGQRVGQPISRENVATPSAQQWTSTPWSVQQGLSGYLDWAGYRPMADVLGNMAQMLPNAPGGGARWSPYIGR